MAFAEKLRLRNHAPNPITVGCVIAPRDAPNRTLVGDAHPAAQQHPQLWDKGIFERDATIFERDATIFERDAIIFERDATIFRWDAIIFRWDATISSGPQSFSSGPQSF